MTTTAPLLKYPGAKWRIAPWILAHMPPHQSYVEPFFGSGAIFFNKPPCRIETINDINGEVVNYFRVCRDHPDQLAAALSLTPWAREERDAAFDIPPDLTSVERARRFAVRCWMTFGASPSKSNGWRYTSGNHTGNRKNAGPDNTKLWSEIPQRVRDASARLLQAQIECRPALDVIERFGGRDTLLYLDPPYVKSTRTGHGDAYHNEMTDRDHLELLEAITRSKGMVLLSGYDSGLYRENLQGWRMVSTQTTATLGTSKTECLWLNPRAAEAAGLVEQLTLEEVAL